MSPNSSIPLTQGHAQDPSSRTPARQRQMSWTVLFFIDPITSFAVGSPLRLILAMAVSRCTTCGLPRSIFAMYTTIKISEFPNSPLAFGPTPRKSLALRIVPKSRRTNATAPDALNIRLRMHRNSSKDLYALQSLGGERYDRGENFPRITYPFRPLPEIDR